MGSVSLAIYRAAIGQYCGGLIGKELYFKHWNVSRNSKVNEFKFMMVNVLLIVCYVIIIIDWMSSIPLNIFFIYCFVALRDIFIKNNSSLNSIKFILILLLMSGDIKPNPGPDIKDFLSVCHCNIRSLNLEKLKHIEVDLSDQYKIIT